MRRGREYENDEDFLREIDELHVKDILVKITVLTWKDERPLQEIQGHVISGELSIDKSSAVRRSGSLTVYVDETNGDVLNINNIISINKKVNIEIGIKNTTSSYTNEEYIWFRQGTFILTDLSITHDTGGVQFSVNLADKMCLLDGSLGGVFTASTTLDTVDQYLASTGEYLEQKLSISEIILEAVHHLGGEELGNIVISDLDSTVTTAMFLSKDIVNPTYAKLKEANTAMLEKYIGTKNKPKNKRLWFSQADADIGFFPKSIEGEEYTWSQLTSSEQLYILCNSEWGATTNGQVTNVQGYDTHLLAHQLQADNSYKQVLEWLKKTDSIGPQNAKIVLDFQDEKELTDDKYAQLFSNENFITLYDTYNTNSIDVKKIPVIAKKTSGEQYVILEPVYVNDDLQLPAGETFVEYRMTTHDDGYGSAFNGWKLLQVMSRRAKRVKVNLQDTLSHLYVSLLPIDATDSDQTIQYKFELDKNEKNIGPQVDSLELLEPPVDANNYSYYVFNTQDSVGYRVEDFVYPGDLTANQGASITSILDNIVQQLGGNFEYFYDIDGRFHFQEIKNYLNTTYTTTLLRTIERGNPDDSNAQTKALAMTLNRNMGKAVYKFENSNMIISYSNQLQYSTIKNDFVLWGEKSTATNDKRPIRYHLAIDKKPETGLPHDVVIYYPYTKMEDGTLEFEDIPFAAQPIFFDEDEDTWILSEPYRGDNFYTTGSWTDKEGKKYTVESLTPAILTPEIDKPGATSYTPTMTLPNEMCYTIMDTIKEEIWKIDAASGLGTFFQEFIGTDGSLYATEDRLKWLKYLLLGGPVNQQVWLYNDSEGESYVYTVDTIKPSDTLDEAGHPIAKTILPTDMCNTIMHTIEKEIWNINDIEGYGTFFEKYIGIDGSVYANAERLQQIKDWIAIYQPEDKKPRLVQTKIPNIKNPDAGSFYISVNDKDRVNDSDVLIWVYDANPPTDKDGILERPHWIVFNDAYGQSASPTRRINSHPIEYRRIYSQDWRNELYLQGVENSLLQSVPNYYYTEMVNEWPRIYNITEMNIDTIGRLGISAKKEEGQIVFRNDSTKEIVDTPLIYIPAQGAILTQPRKYTGQFRNFCYSSTYTDESGEDTYGGQIYLSEKIEKDMNLCQSITDDMKTWATTPVFLDGTSLYQQVEIDSVIEPYEDEESSSYTSTSYTSTSYTSTSTSYTYISEQVSGITHFESNMINTANSIYRNTWRDCCATKLLKFLTNATYATMYQDELTAIMSVIDINEFINGGGIGNVTDVTKQIENLQLLSQRHIYFNHDDGTRIELLDKYLNATLTDDQKKTYNYLYPPATSEDAEKIDMARQLEILDRALNIEIHINQVKWDASVYSNIRRSFLTFIKGERRLYKYDNVVYNPSQTAEFNGNGNITKGLSYFRLQCEHGLNPDNTVIPPRTESETVYFYTPKEEELLTPRMEAGFQPHPEDYNYYLDFIDSSAKIGELSIENIGRRTDAINNTSLNCMIDPDIPTIYLLEDIDTLDMELHPGEDKQSVIDDIQNKREELIKNNYPYAYLNGRVLQDLTSDHYQGLFEAARELLYTETSYNEKITLTCMPIYHLDVNTRITVKDPKTGIYGDYLIDSINVPLDVESTMNITCTKIIDRV